jgi:hypothetical protein
MNRVGRKLAREGSGPDSENRNVFPFVYGKLVPAHAVFLTQFDDPIPKDVDGRAKLIFRLLEQVPRNWRLYVDMVLLRPDIFVKIYEAVFEGRLTSRLTNSVDFVCRSIVGVMKAPLIKARALIPASPFAIFIFPRFFSDLSVDGHCVSSQAIHLFIDPRGDWRSLLPSTLCHEYFHLAYRGLHHGKNTAGQTMIDEALGMHFAEEVTDYRYFTKAKLTDKQTRLWLRKNKKILEKADWAVFYSKRLQPYGFYCGYLLVRPWLESMKTRPDKWRIVALMPPEMIFKLAWSAYFESR